MEGTGLTAKPRNWIRMNEAGKEKKNLSRNWAGDSTAACEDSVGTKGNLVDTGRQRKSLKTQVYMSTT